MRSFLRSMLLDNDGENISTKRVIGILGFLFLAVTMFINSFSIKEIGPTIELVNAVEYITIAALFGTTLDKFVQK